MTARHRPPAALLSFFRLFGLFPFHVDSHSFPEFLVRLLHLINILVELILLYLCYYYARSMFDFSHAIGLIVDVLQIIAPILTHLVSLLECLYERRRMEALWRDLLQLNTTGGRVHLMVSTGSLRKFIWTAVLSFGICTAIEVWILFHASIIWFRSRAVGQLSFMSCRAAFLLYILHVTLVGSVIRMLVAELKYTAGASRSQSRSQRVEMEQKTVLRSVVFCRGCHKELYRISVEMSQCFGWSLICHLMYNFMDITIALYYNYRRVILGLMTAESLLVWVSLLIMFLLTFYSCEVALRPLRTIPYHLHRIQRHSQNLELHKEIMRFSYQLKHEKIRFNARRFLDLDFGLLKGVRFYLLEKDTFFILDSSPHSFADNRLHCSLPHDNRSVYAPRREQADDRHQRLRVTASKHDPLSIRHLLLFDILGELKEDYHVDSGGGDHLE